MLLTGLGRSVLEENVSEVFSTASGGTQDLGRFLVIRTDLGRWITYMYVYI